MKLQHKLLQIKSLNINESVSQKLTKFLFLLYLFSIYLLKLFKIIHYILFQNIKFNINQKCK